MGKEKKRLTFTHYRTVSLLQELIESSLPPLSAEAMWRVGGGGGGGLTYCWCRDVDPKWREREASPQGPVTLLFHVISSSSL